MLPRLGAAAVLVCAALLARAQSDDRNLQNLLAALTNGTEATLVTPLITGELQVTSFLAADRLSAVDAMAVISRARAQLQALGEPQPTAEQIARVLAGGPIELPGGAIQAPGMLTASGHPAVIRSQIVAAGTPLPGSAYSAAAGGTAPPSAARQMAIQQLLAVGIVNPSEDQIRTALVGGVVNTVNGPYQLPGILK
ncbi:MAG: hypothetical protein E6H63_13565 [Betaproteobacteria bacterium]|nr:MAG: hypothetical protein E6H63_13565 [Betaproteobacteria bacterium]TMH40162.1 MAG: hypothetical protein E6H54_19555 [Betaproteobacteria bacterium]